MSSSKLVSALSRGGDSLHNRLLRDITRLAATTISDVEYCAHGDGDTESGDNLHFLQHMLPTTADLILPFLQRLSM